jgi:gas vesicle protein
MTDKKTSKLGLGMLLGLAAGAVAGLFLAPKSGKQLRKDVSKKTKEIQKLLEEKDFEEIVKGIFGSVNKDSVELLEKAKINLAEKLANLKDSLEKLDKEKYKQIVSEVVDEVKTDKSVSQDSLSKLKTYLESDFKKLQKGKKTSAPKKSKAPAKKSSTSR